MVYNNTHMVSTKNVISFAGLPLDTCLTFLYVRSNRDCLILSTIWVNSDYEIWKLDEKRFRIKTTNCYQQVRRLEDGMGEIGCKPAGMVISEAAAEVINPAFNVKCLVCPPDEHPDNVWCEWEFELKT